MPPPSGIGVAVFCIYTRFHLSDRRYLCHALRSRWSRGR
nr:MAG TPA: hypothetical protein [Caudoviricetes sp.]